MPDKTDSILKQFDNLLTADGPAALVVREHLVPVEGADGVLFPATFAEIGYNIDGEDRFRRPDAQNVVLIDSVGSQANRIEPLFAESEFAALVPQIKIKAGDKIVNLLHAGHRAGDAVARCTALKDTLKAAFNKVNAGDAGDLAKIAPTSLVFGVWDSRDTQAKLPRLISSTIRAYNVRKLTRSATYTAPVDYVANEVFTEEDRQKAEGDQKNPLSKRGFVNALANKSHGGVIADGGIRRDATLALAALRLLKTGDTVATLKLRRYILGLSLVAFTSKHAIGYLRQGTILVRDADKPTQVETVAFDGTRSVFVISAEDAFNFSKAAAIDFGVGENQDVDFDPEKAKRDLKGEDVKPTRKNSKKAASAASESTIETTNSDV